jgi:hypothetical protein
MNNLNTEIFKRVIELSPVLLESVDRILEYSQKYFEEHNRHYWK